MKPIRVTEVFKEEIRKQFEKLLDSYQPGQGAITLKLEPSLAKSKDSIRPVIQLTSEAYNKMQALINACADEVAWYGLVEKLDTLQYLITDILCYPQEVNEVRATMLEDEYIKWYFERTDEEINAMRFQGHSHVNMSTAPSGQDDKNWAEILETIKSGFYIFTIGNKKCEYTWYLYDVDTNIMYEPKDIDVKIVAQDGTVIEDWAEKVLKEHVKKTPATTRKTKVYSYGSGVYTYDSVDDYDYDDYWKTAHVDKLFWEENLDEGDLSIRDTWAKGFVWSYLYSKYIKPNDSGKRRLKELNKGKDTPRPKKGKK